MSNNINVYCFTSLQITKGNPVLQLLLLFSSSHDDSFTSNMSFPFSINPCDWGWCGLPLIIFIDGQSAINSFIMDATNSFPLLDCKIVGAPYCVKILIESLPHILLPCC